jgi:uncharacterized protein (TIGR00730 family)
MKGIISVFGSSNPQPGEAAYEEARAVGRLLAEAGYGVATGGYSGVMAAASQGAGEAGGHVVGVTSNQIERWRPLGPNQWVKQEIRYETLRDRLFHLVVENAGVVVMPGGVGTLSEMALAWSLMQVAEIPARPFVLYGDHWRQTVAAFTQPTHIESDHLSLLRFANSPEEAARLATSQEA